MLLRRYNVCAAPYAEAKSKRLKGSPNARLSDLFLWHLCQQNSGKHSITKHVSHTEVNFHFKCFFFQDLLWESFIALRNLPTHTKSVFPLFDLDETRSCVHRAIFYASLWLRRRNNMIIILLCLVFIVKEFQWNVKEKYVKYACMQASTYFVLILKAPCHYFRLRYNNKIYNQVPSALCKFYWCAFT